MSEEPQKVESYQGFLDKFAASGVIRELRLEVKRTTKGKCEHSEYFPPRAKDAEPRKAGRQVSLIKGVRFRLATDGAELTEEEQELQQEREAQRHRNQDELLNTDLDDDFDLEEMNYDY